jgi:cyclophilin family peptidyl-prolyl cis-trans isomerase
MNLLFAVLMAAAAPPQTYHVLSQTYVIDRKYRSMEGPASVQKIRLGDPSKPPELLWITGVRTEMVGEDGTTPQLPELMCHLNVDLDPAFHQALFNVSRPVGSRLITLSQGMLSAKVPDGFGFPIASNEPLLLFTQVLNLNIEKPNNLKVRHRVTIDYVRDRDLTKPMKPLFNVGASGMVQLDNNPIALTTSMNNAPAGAQHGSHNGTSCLIGARAPQAAASSADYVDPQGRKMTGHWIVPPGHQVNHSDVTWFMGLQYDTRLHYAAVHLHPFAQELILRDVTANKDVFRAKATNPMSGIGLTRVDRFTSEDGVMLYKSHQYEIVSVYDNPTHENADSMASVFLGLDDPEFVRPTPEQLAHRSAVLFDADRFELKTRAGAVTVTLARTAAPDTSIQVARLVDGGAFQNAHVTTSADNIHIAIPLNTTTWRLLQPLTKETGLQHKAGTVSYCIPGAGSREIVLSVARRDGVDAQCTAFGRVEGMDALAVSPTVGVAAR